VAEAPPEPSVDERSRAALEALRSATARGTAGPDDLGGATWWDAVERAVTSRWPTVSPATWRIALVGAGVLVGLVAAVIGVRVLDGGADEGGSAPSATLPFTTTTAASPTTTAPTRIVVHAAGAVVEPGVHEVAAGSRVADLLDAAGGATPDADLDRVNLAAPLADGQRLYVPRRGEASPPVVAEGGGGTGASGASSADSGPIDINTADVDALDALPGVGPSTASAIVEHRESKGPFTSVDQLLDVRGIGPAKLDALRDLVTVG
jgi:competence protein ComEA